MIEYNTTKLQGAERHARLVQKKKRRRQQLDWRKNQRIQEAQALEREFRAADSRRRAYQRKKKTREPKKCRHIIHVNDAQQSPGQRKPSSEMRGIETKLKRLRIEQPEPVQSLAEFLKQRQRHKAVMKELINYTPEVRKKMIKIEDYVVIKKEAPNFLSYITSWLFRSG